MSRWVVPEGSMTVAGGKGESADGVLGRIVKYVPVEIVTGFTGLFAVLATIKVEQLQTQAAAAGLLILFLVGTVAYVAIKAPKGKVRLAHLIVTPIAFIAWAYPISSALLGDWFVPLYALGFQAVTVLLAIFVKPQTY